MPSLRSTLPSTLSSTVTLWTYLVTGLRMGCGAGSLGLGTAGGGTGISQPELLIAGQGRRAAHRRDANRGGHGDSAHGNAATARESAN
jgi:hypothetical protein